MYWGQHATISLWNTWLIYILRFSTQSLSHKRHRDWKNMHMNSTIVLTDIKRNFVRLDRLSVVFMGSYSMVSIYSLPGVSEKLYINTVGGRIPMTTPREAGAAEVKILTGQPMNTVLNLLWMNWMILRKWKKRYQSLTTIWRKVCILKLTVHRKPSRKTVWSAL